MQIVAIGGGDLRKKETLRIDEFIVGLTGKRRPNALLIPTATEDAPRYPEAFDLIYGGVLGCKTDHLLLYRRPADRKGARKKILGADLIYVGGGNTLRMMRFWRRLGIDRLLRRAGRAGTVLCGISAGAICWHEWGHSDSRGFSGKPDWPYIRVKGLGHVPGLFCPHLNGEARGDSLAEMVMKHGDSTVACDSNAAVHYNGSTAVCVSSRKRARAHVYERRAEGVGIRSYSDGEVLDI